MELWYIPCNITGYNVMQDFVHQQIVVMVE